ncbi:MAG: hypothetical protein Hals2KO_25420 [Halioglobus sp.]
MNMVESERIFAMTTKLKITAITLLLVVLGGCKIHVLMPEGGEVQSVSSGTCLSGNVCILQVSDTNYTETFTAIPQPGWQFAKWNNGEAFLCADSTNPVCVVTNVPLAGNPTAEDFVASNGVLYLLPVFTEATP